MNARWLLGVCTWLHLVALGCTLLHLFALGCTWLHLVALGGTWLHLVALGWGEGEGKRRWLLGGC